MSNPMIQLLVLAAIAIFLILRLRNVLGTRDGFEPPKSEPAQPGHRNFEVIDDSAVELDHDILDHVEAESPAAQALISMKRAEPSFSLREFLSGAKSAHEMILLAFERGDISEIRAFLADEVADAFQSVIDVRNEQGQKVEAQYLGTREISVTNAEFDTATGTAEISVRFLAEMIVATRDADGEVVEGDPKAPRKQRDVWTFSRGMGQDDPNWQLVATG